MNTVSVIFCLGSILAANVAKESVDQRPTQVSIGIYPIDVYDLDLRKCSYVVDCYVWLRWTGGGDLDPTEFEFVNGSMDVKEHPDRKKTRDVNYVSYRCRGTFHSRFDFRKYPLDSHTLAVFVEDADHEMTRLEYVADADNMRRPPPIQVTGWQCGTPLCSVRKIEYETNYGNPERSSSEMATYSRFCMYLDITRAGPAIYLKTFLGLFISVAIAFLGFLICPTNADARFGVGVAAIFGSVSSEIIVSSNLPDMPYFTLADQIHFASFSFIFLSLLLSCISLGLTNRERMAVSRKLDAICIVLFPLCYAGIVGGMTWLAITT